MSNLKDPRFYQEEIIKSAANFLRGPDQRATIYSPTGSGKTECFMHTTDQLSDILNSLPAHPLGKKLNIGIVHPRIALSQDQLSRFKSTFGTRFSATSFHSGKHLRGEEIVLETNTTNPDELQSIIDASDLDHITFSSYHSLHKIAHIEFDFLICDEAHNLVQPRFFENNLVENLKAKKIAFYTATPITEEMLEDNKGMTNTNLFGNVICAIEPKRLIPRGYVVGPAIQLLEVETDEAGENVDTIQIIGTSYLEQKKEMSQYGIPFIQMLVTSRGYVDHGKVEEDLQRLWDLIGEQVDVYVIEAGSARVNGIEMSSRFAAMEAVKNSGQAAIIMHYDTLSEGIDINTITGVCILRFMKQYKLLQTIGRAGRPHFLDLDSDGEVRDMNNRVKPCSMVTLPVVDGKHIGGIDAQHIAEAFIVGGYEDLTTYIQRGPEDEPIGDEVDDWPEDFDFGEDEDKTVFMSQIKRIELQNNYKRLLELGIVF